MVLTVLPPTDYGKLREICAPLDIYLAVTAILAGETPAKIYVDDFRAPTMALILPWDGHRAYLAGAISDEQSLQAIREIVFSFFLPFRKGKNVHEFLLYYASPSWESYFSSLGQDVETIAAKRCYYLITPTRIDRQAHLPAAWRLRQVDTALLAEQQLQHLPQLITEIHSESPSREDFLTYKFGFCLQEDDILMGWCLSEYNHADRCEVGIETIATYRRHGVAFITASALIAHASAQGITRVGWHCWSHNEASRALALRLGGVLVAEYPVQLCRLT